MASGTHDPARVGLCADCRHAQVVDTRHSRFWLCRLAAVDRRFEKYPRLPVLECDGYERGERERVGEKAP